MFDLNEEEFIVLRDLIEKECGICIGDDKAYLIESKLSSLLVENMCFSFKEFCEILKVSKNPLLIEKVVDQITINETLWFRDESPWDMLDEFLLADYVDKIRTNGKKIRIWSAASSSGQEPYSIAITINEYLEKNLIKDVTLNDFEIIATDICKTVLSIARNAKYDSISMKRGLEDSIKDKYFKTENNRIWLLNEDIKNSVTFIKFNLKDDFDKLGKFDLVLCRYVLIYFTPDLKESIYNKIFNVLEHQGILFLGGGEIYNSKEKKFEIVFNNKTIYLKKGE